MSMKLSHTTRNILKNFSEFNNSIYIGRGNIISNISPTNSIVAAAKVHEQFPDSMALYDIKQFLTCLDIFSDFDLEFENPKYVTIKSDRTQIRYFYADEHMIAKAPSMDVADKVLEDHFTFKLSYDVLKSLIKASNILTLPDMCLESSGGDVQIVVKDRDNSSSNSISYIVGESETPFSYRFKMENIVIIPGNYTVTICKTRKDGTFKAAKFCFNDKTNYELQYLIALEPKSWYGQEPES